MFYCRHLDCLEYGLKFTKHCKYTVFDIPKNIKKHNASKINVFYFVRMTYTLFYMHGTSVHCYLMQCKPFKILAVHNQLCHVCSIYMMQLQILCLALK